MQSPSEASFAFCCAGLLLLSSTVACSDREYAERTVPDIGGFGGVEDDQPSNGRTSTGDMNDLGGKGGGSPLDEGGHSQGGDFSELDGGPPHVAGMEPPEAFPGSVVTLRGEHFLPDPQVLFDGMMLQPSADFSDTELRFVVPPDIDLAACKHEGPLTVRNARGESEAQPLTIVGPGPSLEEESYEGAADATWPVSGSNLEGASVLLGDEPLEVVDSEDSTVAFTVPRETPTGPGTLVVQTECGQKGIPIRVLPPAPRVLSADMTTLSPGGVVFLTVDVSFGATVQGAHVGASHVDASDATSLRWIPGDATGRQRTLALRIPTDLPAGQVSITLDGTNSASNELALQLFTESGPLPPPSSKISLTPVAFADFPIGTSSSFPLTDVPTSSTEYWSYDLRFARKHIENNKCEPHGTITGFERLCPDSVCSFQNGCSGTKACYAIQGDYRDDESHNEVHIWISRSATEDPEEFVGGWGKVGEVPDKSKTPHLVLRSTRTGRQLTIAHQASNLCVN